MFKNKKWIVLLIVIFPSLFWVILETSTINSKKLPFYGPRTWNGKDTVYYSRELVFSRLNGEPGIVQIDTLSFPVVVVMFVKDTYKSEAYRISGFWEYVNYKTDKLKEIPFVFVCEKDSNNKSLVYGELSQMAGKSDNLFFCGADKNYFDAINKEYFVSKPVYVDYSFFVLMDKKRRIRGYYDGRYAAEIKRLIEEYRHLRIKEEKQNMLRENEIKTNS